MKHTFITICLTCLLSGCIISKYQSHQLLVESYHNEFVTTQNAEILNVGAMLRSFIEQINLSTCNNWSCIEEIKQGYVQELINNNISDNYPVQATTVEIKFVDNFLSDLIKHLRKQKIPTRQAGKYISDVSTVLLVDIINHEEKLP